MRGYLPDYEATSARTLVEALTLLAQAPADARGRFHPLAGGTDIMVVMAAGKLPPGRYLDLWSVDELRGIAVTPGWVDLRALTTYTEVRNHPVLAAEFPMLVQAAAESGAIAIQNRGTIAGNIANASPAADTPPALLAYDAEIELVSLRGARWLHYADFHTGYKATRREADELIARVRVPRKSAAEAQGSLHFYRKVGTRKAQAISKVCLASLLSLDGGRVTRARLGWGSVAPIPLRTPRTEAALCGPLGRELAAQAAQVLASELTPIDDVRSTAEYRLRVAQNLIGQLVDHAARGRG